MKDKNREIIYIGKAKNLKNRVSQYFNFSLNHTEKVKSMVENIQDFEYIITDNEYEALLLECNLIKRNLPKYNILLKDDKGYRYIEITNEKWPRIKIVKLKSVADNKKYIGPFMNLWGIKEGLSEAIKIFKLPTCKRNFEKKTRPCLNYYIDQCSAPCAGKISLKDYLLDVKNAIDFLKNGSKSLIKRMKDEMNKASNNLAFEKAAKIRDKIKLIEAINNKQKVVLNENISCDFIAFVSDDVRLSVNILKFDEGILYNSENFVVELNDDIVELKKDVLKSYYILHDKPVDKIFIEEKLDNLNNIERWISEKFDKKIKIDVPLSGEKLKIIKMCKNNALDYLIRANADKNNILSTLMELKKTLNLQKIPNYIEAYDISNLQGEQKVGGLVVFKEGKKAKNLYKKFTIKTVIGQDDYASMAEVIKRRFDKLNDLKNQDEGFKTTPDLILIDGGIEHTKKVRESLKFLGINGIPVFGMVKDNRHRTKALTNDSNEIDIKSKINLFKFITAIQDEVHRFTITFHRKKRDMILKSSELLKIDGIGKKRSKEILKRFKTLERIENTKIEEFLTIPGITPKIATSIIEYFKNKNIK